METKSLFPFIALILTNFVIIESVRGPRDYGDTMPATRTDTPNLGPLNLTARAITLPNKGEQVPQPFVRGPDDWEPEACTKCLNSRYLAHYLAKGCKPVDNGLFCKNPCPKYFECPKRGQKPQKPIEGCEYKGKVYKDREDVPEDNPCKKPCKCLSFTGSRNVTEYRIECAVHDCFGFVAPKPNCFQVYEEGECCSKEKCLTNEQVAKQKKCNYDGKQYFLGQHIYQTEEPCLRCVCDEKWNQTHPLKSSGCKPMECDINEDRMKEGCIPIYHEKTCCPVDWYCPPPKEEMCEFNGKKYMIGESVHIDKERIECSCRIPPVITCIERSIPETFILNPVVSPFNLTNTLIQNPVVSPYNVTNTLVGNKPPLSPNKPSCPPIIPEGLACAGVNCTTIIDKNGCQACKCAQECPTPMCAPGCTFVATTPGVCPTCKCN